MIFNTKFKNRGLVSERERDEFKPYSSKFNIRFVKY